MDRDGVSKSSGRAYSRKQRKSRAKGLKCVERNGYIHITGTLRVAGQSVRIRKTTELSADEPQNWEIANSIRIKKEREITEQVVYGISPKATWAVAALDYLERRQLKHKAKRLPDTKIENDPEYNTIMRFTDFLQSRGLHTEQLSSITEKDVNDFMNETHIKHGHAVSTMERTWHPIAAVFNRAKVSPPKPDLPDAIDKSRVPVLGKWLYPEEIALLINCAADHIKPLMAVQWNTGRRIGELLWLSRRMPDYSNPNSTGLNMSKGNEHIYLGRTKNGQPRIVYLNDTAVEAITNWLKSRKDDYDELFLTNKGVPYARPKKKGGGITKTAYRGARKRAAKILAKPIKDGGWGLPERAKVMLQVTPHWARHNMTSHRLAKGESKEAIKDDLGWSSIEMVERYGHDLAGMGKARANLVQFKTDTFLTRDKIKKLKKSRKPS